MAFPRFPPGLPLKEIPEAETPVLNLGPGLPEKKAFWRWLTFWVGAYLVAMLLVVLISLLL